MARKSRKETAAVVVQEADAACRAAIYVRLSVEDTHTHSVSIETQQMIIARYLEQYPEISVYDTYIDNGATGTNFHRPGFQQMLSDIEAGHVNCVIVKDLSRLGRNTIDTGYYIEQYFRIRSIRFIAVNENFDTANPEDAHSGIIIPLRNMINEAYALDIGRKIRAQQRQAMKDGKFIGARTPYGYLKAEDDCHQLIIDPVAAVVVQRMFRWASEGAGLNTIAVRLNEAGVLTPSHYKKMQGKITHENLLGSGKWQTRTVGVILRSEVYTGDLVQGQTKTVDHRQVKADAEEWTVVRDTHEAIISREQFAVVQENLNQTASRAKAREVKAFTLNLLKGKVFCAHCGGSLHRQRNIRKKSDDVYFYHCLSQSRISKDACPGVTIREDMLLDMLPEAIAKGRRVLLFSAFTSMLKILRRELDDAGYETMYLDGDTPAQRRVEMAEQFNAGQGQIFLISLKAGGTGLNLTGADMVIHYDPWWNPAAEDQATDRAYRIGQTRKVEVIRLVTHASIEEQVVALGQRKKALFDQLIKPGESMVGGLSPQEIMSLFQ